ncbi:MAG: endolytic transglycosylase MltG [Bdellovibrio sp.]|nr:endolytic transglycosylase MltG [Bdellovibrio sp.]
MTNKLKVVLLSIVSLAIAVSVVVVFFGYQTLKTSVSTDKTEVLFDVAPGTNMAQVASDLENRNLIRNGRIFLFYARLQKMNSKIKVGEYSLNKAMTPDEIMSVIISGKSVARNFTVAEGLNMFDVADILQQSGFGPKEEYLSIMRDRVFIKSLLGEDLESLEGYLFPETYKITKFDTPKMVVTQMVKRFSSVWKELQPAIKESKWTRNQIVTFASIVEKETGAGFERPIVSSVFHNRLVRKMKLQTDPTVLYGKAVQLGQMPKNISKLDLMTPTRYNSYTNFGLPPTPISNPGREAILATLKPATSKYLFFVSQNNGTHVFSETYQQHNKAVQSFQVNSKAREGKSWRDLKKKTTN